MDEQSFKHIVASVAILEAADMAKARLAANPGAQTEFVAPEVVEMLNNQVANEMYACYTYTAMAARLKAIGLEGLGELYDDHASEERGHAMRIMEFMDRSGANVHLAYPVNGVQELPESAVAIAQLTMEHEKKITEDWYRITAAVEASGNRGAFNFCQGFLDEQIEEEDKTLKLWQRLQTAGEGVGVVLVDMDCKKD